MRHIKFWVSVLGLVSLVACSIEQNDTEFFSAKKRGVTGSIDPIVNLDAVDTRATVDPSGPEWKYVFEEGDKINIWSQTGTTLIYKVETVYDDGHASFKGGGFDLHPGETYYSSHPLIRVVGDDMESLTTTYEGQVQTGNQDAKHIAEYAYTYASATCDDGGNTAFSYHHLSSFLSFNITVPKAMTVTELTLTSTEDEFFTLDGTVDVTKGTFTSGKKGDVMTLALKNVSLSEDNLKLRAYMAVAPIAAGTYVIRVKDNQNHVYTSPVVSMVAVPKGSSAGFKAEVFEGENPAVCKIGDTPYETLEAAVAAANDGETITLVTDCTGNGIIAPQGKFGENGLTIDFGGHTYDFSGTGVGSTGTEYNGFQLLQGNTVTFKNGTLSASSEDAGFLIQNYSNLTLDNMTVDGSTVWGGYAMSNNNGNVVIKDSQIIAPAGGFAFDVCRYSSYPSVHVTVKGNSIITGNVEVSASGSNAKDGFSLMIEAGTLNGQIVLDQTAKNAMAATPDKAKVSKATSLEIGAPDGYKWSDNGDGTSTLKPIVAQVGGVEYASLEEAFAGATDGQTITLVADCSGNGIIAPQGKFSTSGLTLDFNGHTYEVDGNLVGSNGTETQGMQFLRGNKITLKNGTFTSSKALFLIQNYSDLTLKDMTLSLTNTNYSSAYTLSNNNGTVEIDGTTINVNTGGGFAFDVCRYASYPSVNVTVKGESVINGNVEVSASGSDPKDGFSLTLTSGTMSGNIVLDSSAKTAMANNPDKAVVKKSDVVAVSAPAGYGWVSNGDGTSTLQAN